MSMKTKEFRAAFEKAKHTRPDDKYLFPTDEETLKNAIFAKLYLGQLVILLDILRWRTTGKLMYIYENQAYPDLSWLCAEAEKKENADCAAISGDGRQRWKNDTKNQTKAYCYVFVNGSDKPVQFWKEYKKVRVMIDSST